MQKTALLSAPSCSASVSLSWNAHLTQGKKRAGTISCVDVRASEIESWVLKKLKALKTDSPSRHRPSLGSLLARGSAPWTAFCLASPRAAASPSLIFVGLRKRLPLWAEDSRFCPTKGGDPGACRAATVVGILPLPLPPAIPSLPSPSLRICRGWDRARVCGGPAAHIWPAAGTRPLRTAADPAPSVGAEQRLTSFCAWNARCRGPGVWIQSCGFLVPPFGVPCSWVQLALYLASLPNATPLGPLLSDGRGLADPFCTVPGRLKPCSTT